MVENNDTQPEQGEEEDAAGGFDMKLVSSYLSFAKRALKARKLQFFMTFAIGLALTGLVVKFIPRSYKVTTSLMTVSNFVLDGRDGPKPLAGAVGLITRRENLEHLIRQTHLLENYGKRRPPLLRLKDRISESISGKLPEKIQMAILVGTLETKLEAKVDDDNLEIAVDWSDADTPTEVAQAAQDGFLQMRHNAEISAFQEKMAIVDTHATKLLDEISGIAEQLNTAAEAEAEKLAPATKSVAAGGAAATKPAQRTALAFAPRPRAAPVTDEELPGLKERLTVMTQKLTAAEAERSGRISTETAKLEELKLKFTPSHPEVITQQERVAMASDVPSELVLLRSDVADMAAQIKQREAMVKTGQALPGAPGGGSVARASAAATETDAPLPAGVALLLSREDGDPALKAQLAGAVIRYGSLRDDVREAKMALDTAQAAYNHRYQIVIPVERPDKPTKPNLPGLAAGGVFLSLLLSLILPIVGELRRGVLVEYWQVRDFQLPVLGELQLPQQLPPGPGNERH